MRLVLCGVIVGDGLHFTAAVRTPTAWMYCDGMVQRGRCRFPVTAQRIDEIETDRAIHPWYVNYMLYERVDNLEDGSDDFANEYTDWTEIFDTYSERVESEDSDDDEPEKHIESEDSDDPEPERKKLKGDEHNKHVESEDSDEDEPEKQVEPEETDDRGPERKKLKGDDHPASPKALAALRKLVKEATVRAEPTTKQPPDPATQTEKQSPARARRTRKQPPVPPVPPKQATRSSARIRQKEQQQIAKKQSSSQQST